MMDKHWARALLVVALLISALTVSCVPLLRAQDCPEDPAGYNGYMVRKITIATPIQFFTAASFGFDKLKLRLPLKEEAPFSQQKLSAGTELIRDYAESLGGGGPQKLKFVIVTGKAVVCDSSAQTLDVVYRVFTNIYRPYLSGTFEERSQEVERPATTGAQGGTQGRFLIRPFSGYDASRREYGGVDLVSNVNFAGFQHIELHPSFSANSTVDNAQARAVWNPEQPIMAHAGLQLGFNYLDLPAGSAKLKEGELYAQFVASTKELSGDGMFRYGATIEGGHQQSTGVPQPPGLVVPDSRYGDLKLYVGATGRTGRQAFTGSYGVELGTTFAGRGIDFTKHVADLGYSVRFLPASGPAQAKQAWPVHKSWDIDAHLSAGMIQGAEDSPIVERFFGGNGVQPFIHDDSWVIPGGAFIRSIPENRLGGAGDGGGALGGTRFYSGNLTVAKVLWGKPLLPAALALDRDFTNMLNGAISTAKGELLDYYKAKDPATIAAVAELDTLEDDVQQLTTAIAKLPAAATGDSAVASSIGAIRSKIRTVKRIVAAIKAGSRMQFAALINVQLPALEKEMENLSRLLVEKEQTAGAAAVAALRESIDASRTAIAGRLQAVNSKAAQALANQDFAVADQALNAFLYELNIYSFAPVAVFDVARVWPTGAGLRYAAGGGVRFSLVNVNLTVAYAANPVRRSGEKPGALLFKFDVADLFH